MMTFHETARFIRLQERLRNATYHELRKDGHHKSSEGSLSIAFCLPPVVGDEDAPYFAIEAYSYLLNPDGRMKTWTAGSAAEALALAEQDIAAWCMQSEMEQFERSFANPDESDPTEAV